MDRDYESDVKSAEYPRVGRTTGNMMGDNRKRVIPENLERLGMTIEGLEDVVAILEERLGFVLTPTPSMIKGGETAQDSPSVSGMAERLDSLTFRVGRSKGRINDILAQLEL